MRLLTTILLAAAILTFAGCGDSRESQSVNQEAHSLATNRISVFSGDLAELDMEASKLENAIMLSEAVNDPKLTSEGRELLSAKESEIESMEKKLWESEIAAADALGEKIVASWSDENNKLTSMKKELIEFQTSTTRGLSQEDGWKRDDVIRSLKSKIRTQERMVRRAIFISSIYTDRLIASES